jgi:hypothetical protein
MRLILLACAGTTALQLSLVPAALARTTNHDRDWAQSWEIAGRPKLDVHATDARVNVHTREGRTVEVQVRSRGTTRGLFTGKVEPVVSLAREGALVSVSARLRGSTSGFVTSNVRLEIDVWTPPGSDLTVVTSDGDVAAGPLAGRIDIRTRDGRIRVAELSGDIRLQSTDGSIEAQGLDGRLELHARDGHGRVHGRFDALALEATDGNLDVVVAKGSKPTGGWSVETRDGRIELRLPPDFSATLDAETRDGSLDVDLPVVVHGRMQRHAIRGDLNGGGPVLTLRSTDGGIHVGVLD